MLQTAIESSSIRSAFELFRSNGVEPVLIKGWAAGRFYPKGTSRPTSDVDLAVAAADFANADRLARSSKTGGLVIDLHRELRHLDTCSWQDLFANSHLVDLDGEQIRVLRPEDHLRVLAVHWLTDGGWFRDRLWDIYYAIENRPADFDWGRCLDSVSPIRRRWIICVIGLTHKYFGLDIDDLPFAEEARDLPTLVNQGSRAGMGERRTLAAVVSVYQGSRRIFETGEKAFAAQSDPCHNRHGGEL